LHDQNTIILLFGQHTGAATLASIVGDLFSRRAQTGRQAPAWLAFFEVHRSRIVMAFSWRGPPRARFLQYV